MGGLQSPLSAIDDFLIRATTRCMYGVRELVAHQFPNRQHLASGLVSKMETPTVEELRSQVGSPELLEDDPQEPREF